MTYAADANAKCEKGAVSPLNINIKQKVSEQGLSVFKK